MVISTQSKIEPINFDNFNPGNKYPIKVMRSGIIYRYHTIGDFRKGIAIATSSSFDCLININCEVIFQPRSIFGFWGAESTKPKITRVLGGSYLVMAYRDISSAGKDADYQGPFEEEILDENLNLISFRGIKESQICRNDVSIIPYPFEVPYESGKVAKYGKHFYDLETYEQIKKS
ncbi:hypothetical protein G6M26_23355 [Agrobacterium tumefaciens]|nr:hypothetical protein [Agrobacterium tumefaciens]NTE21481.1 hypothetical protein [Agrobacterium tumefaciens]